MVPHSIKPATITRDADGRPLLVTFDLVRYADLPTGSLAYIDGHTVYRHSSGSFHELEYVKTGRYYKDRRTDRPVEYMALGFNLDRSYDWFLEGYIKERPICLVLHPRPEMFDNAAGKAELVVGLTPKDDSCVLFYDTQQCIRWRYYTSEESDADVGDSGRDSDLITQLTLDSGLPLGVSGPVAGKQLIYWNSWAHLEKRCWYGVTIDLS